eukprot:1065396-Pelagomonas_calceolata.AAC.14
MVFFSLCRGASRWNTCFLKVKTKEYKVTCMRPVASCLHCCTLTKKRTLKKGPWIQKRSRGQIKPDDAPQVSRAVEN